MKKAKPQGGSSHTPASLNALVNQRQSAFLYHYLAGRKGVRGNATKAAMAAGYTKTAAPVTGSRMLRNVNVARAIAEHRRKVGKRLDKRLQEWADMVPLAQQALDETVREAEPSVRVKAAREILDRALGRPKTPVHHTIRNVDALLDEIDDERDDDDD